MKTQNNRLSSKFTVLRAALDNNRIKHTRKICCPSRLCTVKGSTSAQIALKTNFKRFENRLYPRHLAPVIYIRKFLKIFTWSLDGKMKKKFFIKNNRTFSGHKWHSTKTSHAQEMIKPLPKIHQEITLNYNPNTHHIPNKHHFKHSLNYP